jgi:3-hydroxyisobutyrate dehydrogenase-like beta-hydroxyacid dehydrogenase
MTSGTVGFLGLGAMGAPMVRVLLSKGWSVVIAPRDPAKAQDLVDAGARLVATPAAMAPLADTIITCLPDVTAVRDVLTGTSGLLTGAAWRGTLVDTSTIAPAAAQQLGAELAPAGIGFLDAPISGGVRGATAGTLSIMVGGDADVLERVRPVLQAMGSRVIHCGALGAGQVTKACNQLIVMSTTTAVAESMRLAEHAGVDPWIVREVLLGGYAKSPLLEINGPRIIDDDYTPGGRAIFHAKDIATIEEMSQRFDLPLPLFEAVRAQFERLFAAGGGDLDHSAVGTLYPHAAGFPRRG